MTDDLDLMFYPKATVMDAKNKLSTDVQRKLFHKTPVEEMEDWLKSRHCELGKEATRHTILEYSTRSDVRHFLQED
ncbi:hypothetical protein STEG23_020529, partial [Scotinomys teguina]